MLPRRRPGVAVAVAAAIAVAFVAGGFTDAVLHPGHHDGSSGSVVDQAQQAIEAHAANPVPLAVLQQAAVDGMLHALGDPWSAYYEPTQYASFQQTLSGSYSGVGVWVRRTPDGVLRIESVEAGSPAATAGLHAGDVVTAVGGLPVTGLTVADVVSRLRGRPGTDVSIRVERDGQSSTDVLARSTIANDDVTASRVAPGVERLRIAAFTSGVGRWVYQQVAKASDEHLRGIILDLRDDPGGLLTEAVSTASAFLARGPVVSYVQRDSAPDVLDAHGGGDTGIPLVVVVNGGTASAAEIVAGALQDRGRAVIVGSQTFGKGSVQAPDQLSDGSDIELTIGHYLTPDGRSLDGIGITPDVLVGPQVPNAVLYQRAIEVLSGLTADAGSAG
jgi:carboxyl-terminal processing protease